MVVVGEEEDLQWRRVREGVEEVHIGLPYREGEEEVVVGVVVEVGVQEEDRQGFGHLEWRRTQAAGRSWVEGETEGWWRWW